MNQHRQLIGGALVIICCFLTAPGAAVAQDITLDTVIGLAGTDTLDIRTAIEFRLRVSNSSGNNYYGATNGFRLYSTNGATWFPHIYYDTTIVQFPSLDTTVDTTYYGRWADNIYIDSIWDGGYFVNFYSDHDDSAITPDVFGQGSDTIGFGGYQQEGWGLYDSFDEIMFTIKLDSIPASAGGKTICFDSAFYRPTGSWRWAEPDTIPTWDGSHCYFIRYLIPPGPGESVVGGGGEARLDSLSATTPISSDVNDLNELFSRLSESERPFWPAIEKSFQLLLRRGNRVSVGDALRELRIARVFGRADGRAYVRLQQYVEGVPVFGSIVTVHIDAEGRCRRVSSSCSTLPNVSVEPALNSSEAVAMAVNQLLGSASLERVEKCQLELVYLEEGWTLCWLITLEARPISRSTVFLFNAVNGRIIAQWPRIKLLCGEDLGRCELTSQVGVRGDVRDSLPIQLVERPGIGPIPPYDWWQLRDITRRENPVESLGCAPTNPGLMNDSAFISAGLVSDSICQYMLDTTIFEGDTTIDTTCYYCDSVFATGDKAPAFVDGYYYSMKSYDWLLDMFGFNSWDSSGAAISFSYNATLDSNSLGWAGPDNKGVGQILFGPLQDPNERYWLCTDPHGVAHEFFHGVIESTSELFGPSPTQAYMLNETLSMIMGEVFRYWLSANDPDLWHAGARSFKTTSNYDCYYDLSEPGSQQAVFRTADYYGISCGNGLFDSTTFLGLAGIPLKWFHLIAEGSNPPCAADSVEPVGIETAAHVVFDANLLFSPNESLRSAAVKTCYAALELDPHADDTSLARKVNLAWAAVGLMGYLDSDSDGYFDSWDNCVNDYNPDQQMTHAGIGDACFCLDTRGNVDGDSSDIIDIGDLTFLVQYAFKGGPAPPFPYEANLNGIGSIDIADVVYLVMYMFKNGPPPVGCP